MTSRNIRRIRMLKTWCAPLGCLLDHSLLNIDTELTHAPDIQGCQISYIYIRLVQRPTTHKCRLNASKSLLVCLSFVHPAISKLPGDQSPLPERSIIAKSYIAANAQLKDVFANKPNLESDDDDFIIRWSARYRHNSPVVHGDKRRWGWRKGARFSSSCAATGQGLWQAEINGIYVQCQKPNVSVANSGVINLAVVVLNSVKEVRYIDCRSLSE
jgi:hypothetical protein